MSRFYGSKEEEKLNPNIEPNHAERQSNPDPTFGSIKRGSQDSLILAKEDTEPGCCDKCCNNCCSCPSMECCKDYFKVTSADVKKRIGCNLLFFKGGFFDPLEQDYDLYGPFWLYTTMVFVCGAVHNVLIYLNSTKGAFVYDMKIVALGMTVFYVLGLALSAVIGLIFGCLGINSKTSQIVCLYGYSMSTYIICILVCMINSTLGTWILLLYAATTKVVYILKNVFQSLEVPVAKKFVITVLVIAEAGIQFFIIKFAFIKGSASGGFKAAFSHMPVDENISEGILHFRTYPLNY